MQYYEAVSGQNLLDVCLSTYGSLEYLTQLATDNSITLNDSVTSGQIFNWNPLTNIQNPTKNFTTELSTLSVSSLDFKNETFIETNIATPSKLFKAIKGQSILDVCLNTYNSLEFLIQLCQENSISLNDSVASGQVFNWNQTEDILSIPKFFATELSEEDSMSYALATEGGLYIETEDGQIILLG